VALALLATACGSSDSSKTSSATTAAAASVTSAAGATTPPATTPTTVGPQPQSLEQWEALWVQQRATNIKRIKDNHWGKSADGKTLTGSNGWTVDLGKCPGGWSDTEGVTDTTIKIGQSISQSGTYADYGNLGKAIGVLFGYYSDQGLFKDASGKVRKVVYTQLDDGYDAARAIPNVDELLDSEKVFAVWTLGTPATLKTYDKINQRCVPHPMAMTGHAAWGDPVNHPWTTGAPAPTYSTEAILWGSFLEQRIKEFPADRKVRIASMVQNNDFGKLYDGSFKAFLAQSTVLKDRVDYFSEAIEAQAPTVTDPMTTLAAKKPDVFITMLAGTQCTQIITEAAQNGMKAIAKYLFQPQTCPGSTFINKAKVGGDGSAGEGWWIVNSGIKDAKDPTQQSDPYITWFNNLLRSKGIDPLSSSNLGLGATYAFPVIQAIAIAGQLDGGLTRTNFQLALRSMDMTSAMMLPGVRLHMDGLKDAYMVEAGQFQQWDAANQTWAPRGAILDLDGQSKLCAWDQATSQCK
jgi:ABC-type branched-subunit amino acid transport system substrate-binding protein